MVTRGVRRVLHNNGSFFHDRSYTPQKTIGRIALVGRLVEDRTAMGHQMAYVALSCLSTCSSASGFRARPARMASRRKTNPSAMKNWTANA